MNTVFLCFVEFVEIVDKEYDPLTTKNKNFKILLL